jgi:hypothetical protein
MPFFFGLELFGELQKVIEIVLGHGAPRIVAVDNSL